MGNGPNNVEYKLISKSKVTAGGRISGAQVVQIIDWGDTVESNTLHMKLNKDTLTYATDSEKFAVNTSDVKGW